MGAERRNKRKKNRIAAADPFTAGAGQAHHGRPSNHGQESLQCRWYDLMFAVVVNAASRSGLGATAGCGSRHDDRVSSGAAVCRWSPDDGLRTVGHGRCGGGRGDGGPSPRVRQLGPTRPAPPPWISLGARKLLPVKRRMVEIEGGRPKIGGAAAQPPIQSAVLSGA